MRGSLSKSEEEEQGAEGKAPNKATNHPQWAMKTPKSL